MAASKNSRWGWMSQAVASVESGLDRILAEEESATRDAANKPAVAVKDTASTTRGSSDISRNENKNNDRLQARLAHAMAKKTPSRSNTPQPSESVGTAEEPEKDESSLNSQRSSIEAAGKRTEDVQPKAVPTQRALSTELPPDAPSSRASNEAARPSIDAGISHFRKSLGNDLQASASQTEIDQDPRALAMRLDHEKRMAEMQEEVKGCLERIDALQRNLQLLTKETIQNAKAVKTDAQASSQQKEIAEKDEKIALLIEEGGKLAKNELQFRNTIKKLRAQTTSMTKEHDTFRLKVEQAERSSLTTETKLRRAEAEATSAKAQLLELTKSSSDVSAITKERDALQATLAEVRTQLSRASKRAEEAETKASSDKIEVERNKVLKLEEDLSSIRIEQEIDKDKSNRMIEDLKQALSREKELTRTMETEMLAEQAALESKLEAFRLRAEEASAGDQNDSQAKLLRQIETLQSQYNTASQNWQGIESTLLSRITALETERDDVVSHEADLRRKLRDATSKAKSAAREIDELQQSLSALQEEQDQQRLLHRDSQKHILTLEEQVRTMHKTLEQQKAEAERDLSKKLEEERVKWVNSLPQAVPRIDSPVASTRRGQHQSFMDTIQSPSERPVSRRSSAHPHPESNFAHSRLNSTTSIRLNGFSPTVETPSIIMPEDQDDFFANVPPTPTSMTRVDSVGLLNEVISASTAGAGPSVQLVERLSTTVRRLETEKAASKDELHRLSSQRDEARSEVVNLMREVEQKRGAEDRLAELEKHHKELTEKYEKTLELLGEKSEQVDELKADIVDVKEMYRHLADTMGK